MNAPERLGNTARPRSGPQNRFSFASSLQAHQGDSVEAYVASSRSFVDLRSLLLGLLRGWRTIAACAAVGLLLGLLYTSTVTPVYTAQTSLLLRRVPDANVNPASAMVTEGQLAESLPVAAGALSRLWSDGAPIKADDFRDEYRAEIRTDEVLEFFVEGPSPQEAASRAGAVAAAFLDFRKAQLDRQVDQATRTLDERAQRIDSDVRDVSADIEALSRSLQAREGILDPQKAADSRELETLLTRRQGLNAERTSLGSRVAELQLEANVASGSSRVIDEATPPEEPSPPNTKYDLAGGLLLGLVLGAAICVLREVLGTRLRWRQDFAAAAQAPVLVEVQQAGGSVKTRRPSRRPSRRRKRNAHRSDANTALVEPARRLGRHLLASAGTEPAATVIVGLDDDGAALALTLELARELDKAGYRVAVADVFAERSQLARSLRVAPEGVAEIPASNGLSRRTAVFLPAIAPPIPTRGAGGIPAPPSSPAAAAFVAADVALAFTSLAERDAWHLLPSLGSRAIAVVRCARTNEVALLGAARDLAALGVPLELVVLVDPDPRDRTSGHLRAPMPLRAAKGDGAYGDAAPRVAAYGEGTGAGSS